MRKFRTGQRVSWASHGTGRDDGRAIGKVLRKLTSTTRIKGHTAKATPEDPQYLVQSDNGGTAAHHPDALRPERDGHE